VHWLIAEGAWKRGFALLGDSLSLLVQRRVSKETHPDIRVSLCSTSLPPVPLRGSAYKGHPWPFKPLAASMRLVPLRNTYARPPDGEFARKQVSNFRPLGVVGMPRRRVGAAHQPDYAGFTRPTHSMGLRCRHGGQEKRCPPYEINRAAFAHLYANAALPPFHQKVGPGPGPVRRLSGIVT
jgi:hypothetical protein